MEDLLLKVKYNFICHVYFLNHCFSFLFFLPSFLVFFLAITNQIYEISKQIKDYRISKTLDYDIKTVGIHKFKVLDKVFTLEVIDPVDDYLQLMKEIFDFPKLKSFLSDDVFRIRIDAMNGVMGPYVNRIFVEELNCDPKCVVNCRPLPNFGGKHPDPNLTYAADLVDDMKTGEYSFGAAFDGDGDRNMILGQNGFFVTPSDSLAVIAANLKMIPYFEKNGVKGYARSMPTAGAVDKVANKLNLRCYEVPTGWKFFGNLMDSGLLSLCGEESFGTGSDHIREKDGLWAVLAWLTILANTRMSVEEVIFNHWKSFGRNFFTRYDYENCSSTECQKMMERMEHMVADDSLIGKQLGSHYVVSKADNFEYKDPVDGSVTQNQGIRIIFQDGSRIVVRLSGTGSSGSTVRLYVDRYINDESKFKEDSQTVLNPLIDIAIDLIQIKLNS